MYDIHCSFKPSSGKERYGEYFNKELQGPEYHASDYSSGVAMREVQYVIARDVDKTAYIDREESDSLLVLKKPLKEILFKLLVASNNFIFLIKLLNLEKPVIFATDNHHRNIHSSHR